MLSREAPEDAVMVSSWGRHLEKAAPKEGGATSSFRGGALGECG